ncbi:MAG: hypothetical protein A2Y17_05720 [Clostridiales bacterium GWF2_38_85]|nr:MAG: hypothetical protein A2Y17_05720 [Clostridiales bacterium GWF2_38_85]HBL84020.1 16S rRNA (cytosine(967)-C(5))-methyltransferase RsmB [Clostridiales bacterium]
MINEATKKKGNARFCAARSVLRCTKDKAFSNLEIGNTLSNNKFTASDAALYTFLVHGTLERLLTLDYFIDKLSDMGIESIDEKTKAVLRVGLYQLLFTDRIPPSAACNEAVNTANNMKLKSSGFINAVLRNASRQSSKLKEQITTLHENIKYSVSESIYKLIKKQYPVNYTEIFEALLSIEKLPIRVNTLKTTIDDLQKRLPGTEKNNLSPFGLVSTKSNSSDIIADIGSSFFIQSIGSQYSTVLLAPESGQTVIDVCACPGGKSLSAAIEMKNNGRVVSLDLHMNKLSLIKKSAERLGISIIETVCNDARNPIQKYIGTADKVICDVPCSGLGEMSSKPEIRCKNIESFGKLPELQYNILKSSVNYLKENGILVYSTCTINKNENEGIVNRFISENPGYYIDEMKVFTPDVNGEGFFVCKIVRSNKE